VPALLEESADYTGTEVDHIIPKAQGRTSRPRKMFDVSGWPIE
jgi:hypothetical protein